MAGTLTVLNSTVSANSASGPSSSAGGIWNSCGKLTIQNSTVSGNMAANGGGICNFGTMAVLNSTLAGNSANTQGGGIDNYPGFAGNPPAALSLGNTVVAGNLGPKGPDINGAVISQGHNLVGNTSGASGLVAADLQNVASGLDPAGLKNNGGPTQTIALLPGSPAIDAGTPLAGISTDQRGVTRPQGAAPDIGAFESRGFSLSISGGNNGQIANAALLASCYAFTPSFTGGVYVAAVGSKTLAPEIAIGAGADGGPQVLVLDGTKLKQVQGNGQIAITAELTSFYAFAPFFTGGVTVALGDVNGDGTPDVIAGAGAGGGPQVIVVNGTKLTQVQTSGVIASSALLASFYAVDPFFKFGVFISAGPTSGGSLANVIISEGSGLQEEVLNGSRLTQLQSTGQIAGTAVLNTFTSFPPQFGIVARPGFAPVFGSSGNPAILAGAGPGGKPQVAPFDGITGQALNAFFALPQGFSGGVFVSGGATSGSQFDLILGAGPGGGPAVVVVNGGQLAQVQANGQIATSAVLASFNALPASFTGGVRVGFNGAFGSSGKPAILTGRNRRAARKSTPSTPLRSRP